MATELTLPLYVFTFIAKLTKSCSFFFCHFAVCLDVNHYLQCGDYQDGVYIRSKVVASSVVPVLWRARFHV